MSLEKKFNSLNTKNAPGQEHRQSFKDLSEIMVGKKLNGKLVDFSHGDVDAFEPIPESKKQAFLEKIETAIEPKFQDHFVAANAIPHKIDTFPELHKVVSLPKVHFNLSSKSKIRRRRKRS